MWQGGPAMHEAAAAAAAAAMQLQELVTFLHLPWRLQLGNVHGQVISARELVAGRASRRVTGRHKRCAPHAYYVVKSRPDWALSLSACLRRELQIDWHQRPALPISPPSARCGPLA
jgi:hypothetical protein